MTENQPETDEKNLEQQLPWRARLLHVVLTNHGYLPGLIIAPGRRRG